MLKRRSFINVLLALCLLWSQHAALAHSISHIPPPAGKQAHATTLALTAQSAGDEVSDFCLDCLAFSQVTTAASSITAAVAAAIPSVSVVASADCGRGSHPLFSFQARGPPALL